MLLNSEPLAERAAALRRGDRDPQAYAETLCDRIDSLDDDVQAFLPEDERAERLRSTAADLTDRHPDQGARPPLFGVPVGIKDIVHVEGFTTRAGSQIPPDVIAGREATVVERLREAGAPVLGKTVTTEFAGFGPGPTRNPHDLAHGPGGSSSGSAAAVAAGMTPLAVGSQTGGSTIRPAAYCGVVGFKPTYDRIPTDGVIPRSPSLDTVGLFTQDVAGMALAASVACDEWTDRGDEGLPTVGVPSGPFLDQATSRVRKAFRDQVEALDDAGYDVRRVTLFDEGDLERIEQLHPTLIGAELAQVHHEWFEAYEPFYRAPIADRVRSGREITVGELTEARLGRAEVRDTIHEAMAANDVDLWVTPATAAPAPEGITDIGSSDMIRQWTYAGLPSLSLPAGAVDGLPLGLQCVSRFDTDERLLAWAEPMADALPQ